MQLNVLDRQGNIEKSVDVSDAVFDAKFNNALVHQVSVAYRAGGRAGTHAGKNRSAVRGGGAKPYKQKGTGRSESRNAFKSDMAGRRSDICQVS